MAPTRPKNRDLSPLGWKKKAKSLLEKEAEKGGRRRESEAYTKKEDKKVRAIERWLIQPLSWSRAHSTTQHYDDVSYERGAKNCL